MVGRRFREELLKKAAENDSKVIFALDLSDEFAAVGKNRAEKLSRNAVGILKKVSSSLAAVKVNYPLILGAGLEIIPKLIEVSDLPVIADFKIADVPHINQLIAKHAYRAGARAVIAHAFLGWDGLEAIGKVAEEMNDAGLIVVPNMSHPGAETFITPVSGEMAKLAVKVGATGVIGPATRVEEVEALRSVVGDEVLILTPGVGTQGGKPGEAVAHGADFEIVGRTIYQSSDPKRSAEKIRSEINRRVRA